MIRDYEVKYVNNNEVLYIYLDFNSEFAKLNTKKKKKKFKIFIEEFIKRNKIDFKGTTVAIMVSGMMIGTIYLNKPIKKESVNNYSDNYIVSLVKNSENIIENDINEEVLNINVEKEETNESKKKIVNDNKKEESITDITNISTKDNNDNVLNNQVVEDKSDENKTYVTIYRSSGEILNIELEEYLIGVVGAEMPASFNIEALKAQSIVARTYTLKSLNRGKILTDNSSTQNYKNNDELRSMWGNNYNTYYNKIKNAVESTKGMYLSHNGDYIEAVYHSTSNGKTENSKYVWSNSFPYLVSVDSSYDSTNKNFISTNYFSNETLSNKLGQIITNETIYNIVTRNESGRVDTIAIDNIIYTGVELRNKLGLRSTDFHIEVLIDGINITTKGYGHGVGLSQYGANGMANSGYGFKDILYHYYTGVTISYNS